MDLFIILAVVIMGFVVTIYFLSRLIKSQTKTDPVITEWLKTSSSQINQRLDSAAHLMSGLQRSLGEMSEVGRGIKSLQEFLQSPKLRGGLGEQVLNDMIGQTFPKNAFHLQYSFKSGVKVDAVLKTDAGLLCIDSKFPFENFEAMVKGQTGARRDFVSDVKRHIDAIAKKYILPEEGTMDFALMYIPSETIYYEIVNLSELTTYARDSRVYPVSPNTLYAHLQVLLISFQGKELESKSKEVFKILRGLQKDYAQVEDNLGVLYRHLNNAINQMQNVNQSFSRIGQKLTATQLLTDGKADN